ncbi:MAG: glycosyltransferase [Actinomycetota bacterium]
MEERRIRSLMVAEAYPWPVVDGYKQRLSHVIGGLAVAGPVDVVTLERPGSPPIAPSPWPGVDRTLAVPVPAERGAREWLTEWVRGPVPRRVLSTDWSDLRSRLPAWLSGTYDLVWCSHVHTWFPMHDLFPAAQVVVDFDNLENLAVRLRRRQRPTAAPGSGTAARVTALGRWIAAQGADAVDERRWERLQHRVAAAVDRVVVCSELDAERSGVANVSVIPNGAEPAAAPRLDRTVLATDAPTLGFVGALDYLPNTDAVGWFAREVFPIIRTHHPGVRFRVVGRGSDRLDWIRSCPGVELIGAVDDLVPELERTDVAVVPIRIGAGTRLKVVEALANHLPIVSTSVGAEGIAVVEGQTALIADDARRFADACLRLLSEPMLRQQLADAGAELFTSSYDWADIRARVSDLARSVVGVSRE